jgi:Mn2+/Fe2+ NRAMP family transporter
MMLLVLGLAIAMTGVDAVSLTEYAVIFSVVVLPLTYVPILLVSNDRSYMASHTNGRLANVLGLVYLVIIGIVSVSAIPLLIITNAGQS